MKIRLKRMWMNNPKGTEMDIAEGLARQMIQRGTAEAIIEEKPKSKSKLSGMKKKPGRPPAQSFNKGKNKMVQGSPVSK